MPKLKAFPLKGFDQQEPQKKQPWKEITPPKNYPFETLLHEYYQVIDFSLSLDLSLNKAHIEQRSEFVGV